VILTTGGTAWLFAGILAHAFLPSSKPLKSSSRTREGFGLAPFVSYLNLETFFGKCRIMEKDEEWKGGRMEML